MTDIKKDMEINKREMAKTFLMSKPKKAKAIKGKNNEIEASLRYLRPFSASNF